MEEHDEHEWLEDVTGEEALTWVRARNEETVAEIAATDEFTRLRDQLREVLDAEDRIPYVRRRGEFLYNFWTDAAHPRGLWRRTTLDEYRRDRPQWTVLIDVDALAEQEGENWVWEGAQVLRPGHRLALVELSRGGADATVVREFDLETLTFTDGGFALPEAKSSVGWIDADRVYVGTDFGPGALTTSGYPRIVKEWRRGTRLDEAVTVFEGKPDDVAVYGYHDPTPGYERDFVARSIDFYRTEKFLRTPDGLRRLEVPDDAEAGVHRDWLLVRLRTPWTIGGTTHAGGSLLAARFDDFMAGERSLLAVFEPDERTSLEDYTWTRNRLLLNTLTDVRTALWVLDPDDGWRGRPLGGIGATVTANVVATDPDSDEVFVDVSGYAQPTALRHGALDGESTVDTIKQAPAYFDATGLDVTQHFAISEDGTRVPYFVVARRNSGTGPVLLTGYGGFEVSLTPRYSGVMGRGWLARGGTYVVANIRGGGEYGPEWHNGAIRENRRHVYADFAAVARDLAARGVAAPERLGIEGGSNGGLLTGVMLTRYPELFGAVVSQVPLLDMRRYHRLLAGASWMAEYGDPDGEDWEFMREFSPYHNLDSVQSGRTYPPTLFATSTRDDRVHPGHARKMVARMRELGHAVRYYENIEGGHGAAADNAQLAFKWALVLEFLWQQLSDDSGGQSTVD
ncbi:prolyl oligopeptidase [Herbihabitans rhizosphaerae]|uniref:Prolyl oligopeptidase n=1 Tax=Herbihabitans rhizosphaerae TaxID=1872711 RepID=A0A4V2ERE7_9PSEU|nr:prolyl oligopeptidase family serine peptidase [Herbihabitans rhizosphaerae]RZS30592.1 prolyl oligopeptidase [Herbihabitans rhizosphaerae]